MKQRPPLLCLHGFLGCAEDFGAWLGPAEGYARCTRDLPGHGTEPDLERLGDEPTRGFERCLDMLERRVLDLGVGAVDLLGYSMGGRLAYGLLARARISIRRAVLIGARPGIEDATRRSARAAADAELADRLECEPLPVWLDAWYRQPIFAGLERGAGYAAMRTRRDRGQSAALAETLRHLGPGMQPSYWDALSELKAESVLLVAGERDPKYVDVNRRAAERMSHGLTLVVHGAGHAPHEEQPQAMRTLVDAYFAP